MKIKQATLEALNAKLAEENVATRQGPGSGKLSYLEGHFIIEQANRIFGHLWDMEVEDVKIEGKLVFAKVLIRVTVPTELDYLGEGQEDPRSYREEQITRQDVGVAIIQGKGDIPTPENVEMAYKGAVTDAMKRCFRTFGQQFGNHLYDKDRPKETTPARPAAAKPAAPAPAGPCADCARQITGYEANGKQVSAGLLAASSKNKFGRSLCRECYGKAAQAAAAEAGAA